MSKQTTDFNEFLGGDYFARKAAEYSLRCTNEENERRRVNGSRPNVAGELNELPDSTKIDLGAGGLGKTYSLEN